MAKYSQSIKIKMREISKASKIEWGKLTHPSGFGLGE